MKTRSFSKKHVAFVMNLSETGLAVARSLGRKGITVIGVDCKKHVGFFSRYVKGKICPDPIQEEKKCISFLIKEAKKLRYKPVLYIASDNFLTLISQNQVELAKHFLLNVPNKSLFAKLSNKSSLSQIASKYVDVPKTHTPRNLPEAQNIVQNISYPLFLKGLNTNQWRAVFGDTQKGFVVRSKQDLLHVAKKIHEKNVSYIIQEIVEGPDTNHFKICSYISTDGKPLLHFTLQKIRQNPIHFGIGCSVKSVYSKELVDLGEKLFLSLGSTGVVSAEFKRDEKDGRLKLIEINQRYWQQNALATVCGMNFPFIQYLDLTGQNPKKIETFKEKVLWLNLYLDIESFLAYQKKGMISFRDYLRSLRGRKILSDFSWDDIVPGLYMLNPIGRILSIPKYLWMFVMSFRRNRHFKSRVHLQKSTSNNA